jgi:hypothetical protein
MDDYLDWNVSAEVETNVGCAFVQGARPTASAGVALAPSLARVRKSTSSQIFWGV